MMTSAVSSFLLQDPVFDDFEPFRFPFFFEIDSGEKIKCPSAKSATELFGRIHDYIVFLTSKFCPESGYWAVIWRLLHLLTTSFHNE